MKHSFPVLAVALALGALAFVTGASTPAQAADTNLTFLFNASVRAELEDCGCPSRPLGGLARRAHVLAELREKHPDAILLDAGSLFGDPTRDTLDQSRFVAKETAAMGYEVVGVGAYELGHGIDVVRQVAASSGLTFVSANVQRGGDLLFEPYRLIERDGVTVAVTSVFDPAYLGESYMANAGDVGVNDAVEALRNWLPEMDAAADVVVVLSNMKQRNAVTMLRGLQESGHDQIDLVIDGTYGSGLKQPRRFGSLAMVAANNRGKLVGQADLQITDGEVVDVQSTIHHLDVALPEDPALAERVRDFTESRATLVGGR